MWGPQEGAGSELAGLAAAPGADVDLRHEAFGGPGVPEPAPGQAALGGGGLPNVVPPPPPPQPALPAARGRGRGKGGLGKGRGPARGRGKAKAEGGRGAASLRALGCEACRSRAEGRRGGPGHLPGCANGGYPRGAGRKRQAPAP